MSTDATAQATSNKKVVMDFAEVVFQGKDPAAGARDFMGETYTQHNPQVPDGKDAFVGALSGMFEQTPDFSMDIKRVIADDDLVAIHSHVRTTAEERGMAVVDIFRVADGKIVEHWDILQPVPEEEANPNTMF